ncbi:MAG: hypothetical protein M5U26_15610 [Planctomycetota bacterium]|nr:hypothetical protein [Planctomycetota bacterium]
MEGVMKYLFWVVLAAILVIAAGVYMLMVPSITGESATLKGVISAKAAEVQKYAADSSKVVSSKHVEAVEAYRKQLAQEETAILGLWEGKGLKLPDDFAASPKDSITFDNWLIDKRAEILKLAEQAGLKLPADFGKRFLFEGQNLPSNDEAARQARLKQAAIVQEVVRVLSSVKVKVPHYAFNPDAKAQAEAAPEMVDAGVLRLDNLTLSDPEKTQADHEAAYAEALKLAGAPSGAKETGSTLQKSQALTLLITLPAQAVPAVARALENSDRWVAAVRKIDTQRIAQPFAALEDLRAAAPAGEAPAEALQNLKLNTYFQEAGVQAYLELDLVEFDREAAKKLQQAAQVKPAASSKTAAAKKKTGAK